MANEERHYIIIDENSVAEFSTQPEEFNETSILACLTIYYKYYNMSYKHNTVPSF